MNMRRSSTTEGLDLGTNPWATPALHRAVWLAIGIGALAVLLAACGGGSGDSEGANPTPPTVGQGELTPIAANSELVVGPNKFGMGLIDANNEPILGDAGTTVRLRFLFDNEVRHETDARFLWAIPDVSGFWRASVTFDEAGRWKTDVLLTRGGQLSTVSIEFTVLERGAAPMIGDPAPATSNLTLADVPDFKRMSTDEEPEPALYQMTVSEALNAGRPLVVVFPRRRSARPVSAARCLTTRRRYGESSVTESISSTSSPLSWTMRDSSSQCRVREAGPIACHRAPCWTGTSRASPGSS